MSRELIANNLVTTLQDMTGTYRPKKVTREPFDFSKLSNAQFPAILVETASEDRSDATQGDNGARLGEITYRLVCFVKSGVIDTARNGIAQAIENKLEADRTRGGYALDTQVVSIDTDDGSIHPVGGVIITVRIIYHYTRGNA